MCREHLPELEDDRRRLVEERSTPRASQEVVDLTVANSASPRLAFVGIDGLRLEEWAEDVEGGLEERFRTLYDRPDLFREEYVRLEPIRERILDRLRRAMTPIGGAYDSALEVFHEGDTALQATIRDYLFGVNVDFRPENF